jgi:hypothetical protein
MMIAICDVYDALALKRSYKKDYPPDKIYEVMMLDKGKNFDPLLLDKFFQFTGVWPVGTLVSLSDERIGVVRQVHEQAIFSPTVEIIAPDSRGEMVDLVKEKDVRVKASLNPQGEGKPYLPFIASPA